MHLLRALCRRCCSDWLQDYLYNVPHPYIPDAGAPVRRGWRSSLHELQLHWPASPSSPAKHRASEVHHDEDPQPRVPAGSGSSRSLEVSSPQASEAAVTPRVFHREMIPEGDAEAPPDKALEAWTDQAQDHKALSLPSAALGKRSGGLRKLATAPEALPATPETQQAESPLPGKADCTNSLRKPHLEKAHTNLSLSTKDSTMKDSGDSRGTSRPGTSSRESEKGPSQEVNSFDRGGFQLPGHVAESS